MAQDIVPLEPIKDTCPWCGKPVRIKRSLAIYETESIEQHDGLEKDETPPEAKRIPRLLKAFSGGKGKQ